MTRYTDPDNLDSVKKTLQENFAATCAGGAPDSLHIYYRMEGISRSRLITSI